MLYFYINDGHIIDWHVGEKVPEIWQPQHSGLPHRFVTMIYADGDELLHIINQFENLPYCKGRSTKWTGEFAKFIFENLK